jgi:outer membrane protein OmpA-like peptidoglycan-associated protein
MRFLTCPLRTTFFILTMMLSGLASRSQTLIIHFYFDKFDLNTSAKFSIDSFLTTKKNKLANTKIKISGHCDAIGSTSYNDYLSVRRIETVKKYLEDNYLDTGMITMTSAHGERKPLNKNKTENERMVNRRVEITFMQTELDTMLVQEKKSLKEILGDTVTKSGTRLVLRNINFIGGTHRFLSEAYQPLQELLDAMKSVPNLIIEVHGHICCSASTDDGYDIESGSLDLSFQRANAVKKYLVDNGIDSNRISCRGIGHFNPIYPFPEKNEYERQANRRVEIQVITK